MQNAELTPQETKGLRVTRDMMVLAVLGIGIVVFIALHLIWYIKPSDIQTVQEFDARIQGGEPMVVEFYSNL